MTEAEWLEATDSQSAIMFLDGKVSIRKLRLFGVECCWLSDRLRNDAATRHRLAVIEEYAEGRATGTALREIEDGAWDVATGYTELGIGSPEVGTVEWSERWDNGRAFEAVAILATSPNSQRSLASIIASVVTRIEDFAIFEYELRPILHDIIGNPFRPVAFAPAWRTDTAVVLAQQMYESRDFGAMPILADALQDAGCDSADVLDHCRGEGPHVRGCWVVDLVLGKE
jgi:hypothetical protein